MEFKTKIELALPARLLVNADDMLKDQGNVAAKHIRERMKTGRDADGHMPLTLEPDPHERMNNTGELIRSIKRKGGRGQPHRVQATGKHSTNGQRNAAIAAIQVAKTQHDLFGMDKDLETKLSEQETSPSRNSSPKGRRAS